jgi:excisionase family DNA binding protein
LTSDYEQKPVRGMVTQQWFTVAQVAQRLNQSEEQVRHLIRARYLGFRKLNPDARRPTYRISEAAIQKYEAQYEKRAA